MRLPIRSAIVFGIALGALRADTWSGALVNAKCYSAAERNVNPTDTSTAVDRDRGEEIRYCSPNAKTKLFAVVQQDATSFELDPSGNAKAADLVRRTGKKQPFFVTVTGELKEHTVRVDEISAAR